MSLYVSYQRVSTERTQGADGHGMFAQADSIKSFLERDRGTLLAAYVEVASGLNEDRPKLVEAVRRCKALGAYLLVARTDRLTREPATLRWLEKEGVRWIAADAPHASDDQKDLEAALGKITARRISVATKLGLAAAKARGSVLGGYKGFDFTTEHCARSAAVRRAKARERAHALAEVVGEIRASGATTLAAIADGLNARRIPTARGKLWRPQQVADMLKVAA
jgi:DNA invertase Pin-like site-specific DNA recombinase